ncbi:MAG TPA: hypothetical protein VH639_07880 [Bryobacteraceae bacterium]|jgi:hypothetical protein
MREFCVLGKKSTGLVACLALSSALSTTGCLFAHAKPAPRAFRPPPIQVKPVVIVQAYISEFGPELDFAPPENPADVAILQMPDLPAPPPKPSPTPPRAAPAKTAPPQPPPSALPRISQIYSPAQLADYNRAYNEFLGQVSRDLDTLSKRRLSADQKDEMERIVTFKKQAEEQFERDLGTAVELARRASSLAEDLVSRAR